MSAARASRADGRKRLAGSGAADCVPEGGAAALHRRHHGANDMDPQTIERAIKRCIDISVRLGALEDEVSPRGRPRHRPVRGRNRRNAAMARRPRVKTAGGWPGGRFGRRAAPEPSPQSQARWWRIAPVGTEHHDHPVRSLWVKSVPQARALGSALMKRRGGDVRGGDRASARTVRTRIEHNRKGKGSVLEGASPRGHVHEGVLHDTRGIRSAEHRMSSIPVGSEKKLVNLLGG